MKSKATSFFRLLLFAIALALASAGLACYVFSSHYTSATTRDNFELTIAEMVAKRMGVEDADSMATIALSGRHHHRSHEIKCEDGVWRRHSRIKYLYNVALVLTVDQKGCGNFSRIQKAVDAVPNYSQCTTVITIDTGTYREKVLVPAHKTNVVFQGQGYLNTVIVWNDIANSTKGGTKYTASVDVLASNFSAFNISFTPQTWAHRTMHLCHLLASEEARRWRLRCQVVVGGDQFCSSKIITKSAEEG